MGVVTETWVDIVGYEGHYQVSNLGQIWSLPRLRVGASGRPTQVRGRVLRAGIARNGYPFVILSKDSRPKNVRVHRVVAQAFIPNPLLLPEVNHIDGDKANNVVANLEWVTRQGNVDHACRTGLMPTGVAHWRCK